MESLDERLDFGIKGITSRRSDYSTPTPPSSPLSSTALFTGLDERTSLTDSIGIHILIYKVETLTESV